MGSPLGNFPSHPLFGCEHRYRSSDTGTQRSGVSRRYSHARLRCNHRFGRSTRTREALYGEIRNAIRSAPTRSQLAPWLAALTISHQDAEPPSHVLPIRPIGQKCPTKGEKCTRARAPSKARKRTVNAPSFAPRARGRIPSRIHAYLREERQSPIRWARNLLIRGSARRGSMRMCRPARPPDRPADDTMLRQPGCDRAVPAGSPGPLAFLAPRSFPGSPGPSKEDRQMGARHADEPVTSTRTSRDLVGNPGAPRMARPHRLPPDAIGKHLISWTCAGGAGARDRQR